MKTLKLLKNSFFIVLRELEVFPEILASDSFLPFFFQVVGYLLHCLSLLDKIGFGCFSSSAVTNG